MPSLAPLTIRVPPGVNATYSTHPLCPGKCKTLVESARIQHAEDLILFDGHQGALKAIDMLKNIAGGKQGVSIKWDGSPAVVFGINPNNEFIFTDKAGFNAKNYDGKSTNPDDLESMIMNRAKDESKRNRKTQKEKNEITSQNTKSKI